MKTNKMFWMVSSLYWYLESISPPNFNVEKLSAEELFAAMDDIGIPYNKKMKVLKHITKAIRDGGIK